MKKKPAKKRGKRGQAEAAKDLTAKGGAVSGGAENQVFTSVSNVLKTRHDTAKNSISNIR
jgi:hypothetical protein